MLCKDTTDLIEPLASGELGMDDALRTHFETCPRCAGRLASARRLDALLKSVEVPRVPSNFTSGVLQRIRRERWRSEQNVDRLFNVAIVLASLLVAGGIAAMLNVEGLFAVTGSAWVLVRDNMHGVMREAAPTVLTYSAAAGLLASAIAMWWWAERRWLY